MSEGTDDKQSTSAAGGENVEASESAPESEKSSDSSAPVASSESRVAAVESCAASAEPGAAAVESGTAAVESGTAAVESGTAAVDSGTAAEPCSAEHSGQAKPASESMRRSHIESALAALKYVGQASGAEKVQVRTSDRMTVVALLVCCIVEVLSLAYTPLAGYRLAFICFSDIVLSVAVICFLVVRLGILSTLAERQVIICWQLMMGCVFLGIFLTVNVACAVAFFVSSMNPLP